jgi:hypothetical protein
MHDSDLNLRLALLNKHGPQCLLERLEGLRLAACQREVDWGQGQMRNPNMPPADIQLATVIKAKGLEWNTVVLARDFIVKGTTKKSRNMLYVALTRCIRAIQLPAELDHEYRGKAEAAAAVEPRAAAKGAGGGECPGCGASVQAVASESFAKPVKAFRGEFMAYPGARVQICGLVNRADLNGALGTLVSYNPETSRWECDLDDGTAVNVKPANFEVPKTELETQEGSTQGNDEAAAPALVLVGSVSLRRFCDVCAKHTPLSALLSSRCLPVKSVDSGEHHPTLFLPTPLTQATDLAAASQASSVASAGF